TCNSSLILACRNEYADAVGGMRCLPRALAFTCVTAARIRHQTVTAARTTATRTLGMVLRRPVKMAVPMTIDHTGSCLPELFQPTHHLCGLRGRVGGKRSAFSAPDRQSMSVDGALHWFSSPLIEADRPPLAPTSA